MANKILIEITTVSKGEGDPFNESEIIECPLLQDPAIELQSTYTSANDIFGSLSNIINTVSTISAGITGGIGKGLLNLSNTFNLPIWQKTEPVKLAVTLGFYTIDEPSYDVIDKVNTLISQAILSKDPLNEGRYIVPGMSLSALNQAKDKNVPRTAKVCSVWIPGVIYIPLAYIETARPTYSKQIISSSFGRYPLWATVELQLIGLYPAVTDIFWNTQVSDVLVEDYNLGRAYFAPQ